MVLCPSCGVSNIDGVPICPHHTMVDQEWSRSNRAWCDFFHRGIVPAAEPSGLVDSCGNPINLGYIDGTWAPVDPANL